MLWDSQSPALNVEAWVKSKLNPSEICGEEASTGKGFSPCFSHQYHATSTT